MKQFFFFNVVLFLSLQKVTAQEHPKVDLDKQPPQWVWKGGKYAKQVAQAQPIQKELQRIFQPSLPDGIHATYGVAWGDGSLMGPGTPNGYSTYVMLKKYEYVRSLNIVRPEGETSCWIYFQPNTLTMLHWNLPGRVDKIRYNNDKQLLFVCNIRIEKDANGNRILYTDSYGEDNIRQGYCFSANNRIPVRRITRKELFTSYKLYMDQVWDELIAKYEKSIATDEKNYNAMSAEQQKQESYWPELLQRNKNDLNEYKNNKTKLAAWYQEKMKTSRLDEPAVVENLFQNIDVNKLDVSEGFHVWVDDPSFFDKTKSADVPQFLFLHTRRQDADLPKKLFMDRFFEAFNLDVLCRMTGEAPKKPGSINIINASITNTKTETTTQQQNSGTVRFTFQNERAGTFPAAWKGTKNSVLQDVQGSNWLALSKAGYWYPPQYNKTIENGFTLSFHLQWDKDISYYSGLFAVTLAEMQYDNTVQGFKTEGTSTDFQSFYDSYTAALNRMVLQFDPYFNEGGQLQVTVYDKRNTKLFQQKVLLPQFYREKNTHQLQLIREGNKMVVKDNGSTIAQFENVFTAGVRWNAFVFSRYRASDDSPSDMYYIKDVEVTY